MATHPPNRPPPSPRRFTIIHNPVAGGRRVRKLIRVAEALRKGGAEVHLMETTAPGDATRLAQGLSTADCDVVVAAGGDGTINEVVRGLLQGEKTAEMALGIIPLGTANVLAFECGIGTRIANIVKRLQQGTPRPVFVGLAESLEPAGDEATPRPFILMAGAGLDAHVVDNVSLRLKRSTGKLAYIWETLKQCVGYTFPTLSVTMQNGLPISCASVVVCNGRHYGGPFIAAPEADLSAAQFQVVCLTRGGWWHTLRYGAALPLNRIYRLSDVSIHTATDITLIGRDGAPVQADGDIIAHLPCRISLANAKVSLLMP